jgi:hypothetical protein
VKSAGLSAYIARFRVGVWDLRVEGAVVAGAAAARGLSQVTEI